jgi:Concanavalin A-like lectin/glucanases superfamily
VRTTAPRLYKPPVGIQLDQGATIARSLGCCLDFNEMAGPPHDATGNGNTGTINGGVTWANNGTWGSCLSFNGSTGYLTFPAATVGIAGATSATISTWVYPNQTGTGANWVANTPTPQVNGGWYLRYTATGAFALRAYYSASSSTTATTATTYADNKWYHVVGVITEADLYVYVNGVLANTTSFGQSWTAAAGLWLGSIGGNGTSPSLFWTGQLDGFRFWSRALAAADIASLYANYWQIYQPPWSPAWWTNGYNPPWRNPVYAPPTNPHIWN